MTRTITLREDRSPDHKGRDHLDVLRATIKEDGTVLISGAFSGAAVEEFFGDFDHEFGFTIPAEKVATALALVLSTLFATNERYQYNDLVDALEKEGACVNRWVWT